MTEPININIVQTPLNHGRTTLAAVRDLVEATDDWPEETVLLIDHDGITVERVR